MKFVVRPPGMHLYPGDETHWWENIGADEILAIARAADELGFDYLHCAGHLIVHDELVPVMGARWAHCVTAISVFAGATKNIRISGLVVLPYHRPIELAKSLATLDFLSGGRLTLIPATGRMPSEFELLGSPPYADRRLVVEEYLAAMIELWSSDRPRFSGKYVSFEDVAFEPKPVQKPWPPIWIAGNTRAALRHGARFADGWRPSTVLRSELPAMLDYLFTRPDFERRERPFEVYMNLFEGKVGDDPHTIVAAPTVVLEPDVILEQVEALAGVGATVTGLDILFGNGRFGTRGETSSIRSTAEYIERLHWFAEEVLPEASRIGAGSTDRPVVQSDPSL